MSTQGLTFVTTETRLVTVRAKTKRTTESADAVLDTT